MSMKPQIIISNQDAQRLEILLDSLSSVAFPAKAGLAEELDRLDQSVVGAGGDEDEIRIVGLAARAVHLPERRRGHRAPAQRGGGLNAKRPPHRSASERLGTAPQ